MIPFLDDSGAVKKSLIEVETSFKIDAVSPHPIFFYRPKILREKDDPSIGALTPVML